MRRVGEWKIATDPSQAGRSPEKLVVFADTPIEAYVAYEVSEVFQPGGPSMALTIRPSGMSLTSPSRSCTPS